MNRKQEEISELLRREISSIVLRELRDPRIKFVTITRVEVASDYRSAKVYVTVRGPEAGLNRTLEALTHAKGHIQGLVADRIKLRHTPVLAFLEDRELLTALRVNRLIDEVRKQDQAHQDG